jgi:transposase InsO family protein
VLTDNGSAYVSHAWRDEHRQLGITHSRTRPRRPQTNGKVERLNRTLLDEWAYKRLYTSEKNRRAALSGWLHHYNHHRPHTALGNLPPISRCTNVRAVQLGAVRGVVAGDGRNGRPSARPSDPDRTAACVAGS